MRPPATLYYGGSGLSLSSFACLPPQGNVASISPFIRYICNVRAVLLHDGSAFHKLYALPDNNESGPTSHWYFVFVVRVSTLASHMRISPLFPLHTC
jgi:hypothetical protein